MQQPRRISTVDLLGNNRMPPGQEPLDHFPVLHEGSIPGGNIDQWKIAVTGLVKKPLDIGIAQLKTLEQVELHCDIHCVEGWSVMDTLWKGVSSSALATLAGVKPQARFVIVSAPGAFSTNLSLDDFLADDVILAWEYGHELLAPEHGGPLRLIVPRLYFWKSIKWLTTIHFSDVDRPGYWERAGYHNHGDPWREERFSPERARRQAGL